MKQELTVRFFNGPPIDSELEAGQIGINFPLFEKTLSERPKKHSDWESLICRLVLGAEEDGTLPRNDMIADVTGFHRDKVARVKTQLEKLGLIYRINFNGAFAYSPQLAIVRSRSGSSTRYPRLVREQVPVATT